MEQVQAEELAWAKRQCSSEEPGEHLREPGTTTRLKQTVMLYYLKRGPWLASCNCTLLDSTLCQSTNPAPGVNIAVSDAACSKVLHCCSPS